jgi:hypothetical protein
MGKIWIYYNVLNVLAVVPLDMKDFYIPNGYWIQDIDGNSNNAANPFL